MIKVLFVCLGNICRSPLAEAIFLKHLEEQKLSSSFLVDSCGTASYHIGELADKRTRAVAREFGIEMPHRARQFKNTDFDSFDYILVMDESNLLNLKKISPIKSEKILFLRSFDAESQGSNEVPDPYYHDLDKFYEVHQIVERSTLGLLNFIQRNHGK